MRMKGDDQGLGEAVYSLLVESCAHLQHSPLEEKLLGWMVGKESSLPASGPPHSRSIEMKRGGGPTLHRAQLRPWVGGH